MMVTPRRAGGFGTVLVLLAIAAFVTAFMLYKSMGAVAKRFGAAATTATSFKKIDDALVRFVMLNQRLPCPASGTANTGNADPPTAATTCNSPAGIVPWNTLGLSQTDATDPWGRYFFYRVYDGSSGFTQTNGLSLSNCLDEAVTTVYTMSGAGSTCNSSTHENTVSDFFASKGLTVNDMGTAKTQIAYVLISAGESGLGGYYPGGTAALTSPSTSSKEYLNAGSGGTYWITAPSDPTVAATDATHFDDVLSYAYALDVDKHASLAGRAWPLSQQFTQTTLGVSGSNYNTQANPVKVASATLVGSTNQGPVMVTAAADTTSRVVCATSTSPQGAAPCVTGTTNGNDLLSTTDNESLTFDFRVTRKKLVIQLTDFKQTGSDQERAQITLFNGSTQVYQATAASTCSSGGTRLGQYTIDLSASGNSFTKVVVKALTTTNTASPSDFGVAAILACKTVDATCAYSGWTTATCSATL